MMALADVFHDIDICLGVMCLLSCYGIVQTYIYFCLGHSFMAMGLKEKSFRIHRQTVLHKLEDITEAGDGEYSKDVFVDTFNIYMSALFLCILQYAKEDTQTG